MANVPTVAHNEATPAGTDYVREGDDRIRELKTQFREVIAVDHKMDSAGQGATWGMHKWITFIEAADIGTGAEGLPILGAQTVGGKAELTFTDEDDNDIQITSAGNILSGMRDAIIRGFTLTYKTTADVYVEPGTLFCGNTPINTVARTTLTLGTAADWWDGATDSYAGGAGWCYIGVDVSGNIKLLGANAPDKADSSGNTVGTLLYWYDATLYWRVIGAVRVHTDNTILLEFTQIGDTVFYDTFQSLGAQAAAAWADDDCSAFIPDYGKVVGVFHVAPGDGNAYGYVRTNGATSASGYVIASIGSSMVFELNTDGSQIIETKGDGDTGCTWYVCGYKVKVR